MYDSCPDFWHYLRENLKIGPATGNLWQIVEAGRQYQDRSMIRVGQHHKEVPNSCDNIPKVFQHFDNFLMATTLS